MTYIYSAKLKVWLFLEDINAQSDPLFALFGPAMKDFFKYLTVGDDDRNWGLFLTVVGKAKIDPCSPYPSTVHPTGYHYKWSDGRVLEEYQLNYVSEGYGVMECDQGKFQIKPGSMMIIRPGVWHRYQPDKKTGWQENYIGIDGLIAKSLLGQSIFSTKQPVIQCGYREEFIDTYFSIYDLVQEETPGFQQICSGLVVKLLGSMVAYKKQLDFTGKHIEQIIQKARFSIHQQIEQEIDLKYLAEQHQIGYSYFRKMFKKYTGVSPHQYHLELKVMRAKELLLTTDKSIKEIGYELGFRSIFYFSRFFKNKVGINPSGLKRVASRKI